MVTTKSYGYTDSNASAPLSVSVPKLAYAADFAPLASIPSSEYQEARIVNTTTPVDQPEEMYIRQRAVKNVYSKRTDIDPVLYAPTKAGKSTVVGVSDTLRVTKAQGSKENVGDVVSVIDYPVSCHFVFEFPISADIDAADVQPVILRALAATYNNVADTSRLNDIMRGSLSF